MIINYKNIFKEFRLQTYNIFYKNIYYVNKIVFKNIINQKKM